MSTSDDGIGAGCGFAFLALWVAGAVGWVANIVKLFTSLNDPLTVMVVARAIGVIVSPIGCIIGWL